jgi:predicted nicotinamide N-methyase
VLVPGQRILEIGCGLALASLVGHRRGADVTASDCHPLAARFLARNLALNALPPMNYRHGDWARAAAPAAPRVRPGSALRGRYELLMGSDVLYDRDASTALAGFIGRHAAPAGEVWIVDPDRGNRPAFNRRMGTLGYALEDCRIDSAARLGALAYRGRLLVYRRES